MEIGFSIPGVTLQSGTVLGLDTGVCDDDGDGRKSLQIGTGKQVDFWITMDHYGKLRLVEQGGSVGEISDRNFSRDICGSC